MSEHRKPDLVIYVKSREALPKTLGKKSVKIELFRAEQFRNQWDPFQGWKFYPTVPMARAKRDEFFRERFRVRVDGRWICEHAKYEVITWGQFTYWLEKKISGKAPIQ